MFVLVHVLVAIHKEKKKLLLNVGTLPDYVSVFNNDNDMTTEVTWIMRMGMNMRKIMVMINNDNIFPRF